VLKRWLPWRFLIRRTAKRFGIIDPVTLLAQLRRFAQPSEVQEPIELLRAGILFHARGLINTKAIQYNLDWIWPYWVERQFNPGDASFIPRGFSFSHVNLTHRNWTAVGLPDLPVYPIVDPRGMVTPFHDGWSLDFWVTSQKGKKLFPSQLAKAKQDLKFFPGLCVETHCRDQGMQLKVSAKAETQNGSPCLVCRIKAASEDEGWLVAALRPYNPEGIQFIEEVEFKSRYPGWRVNGKARVFLSETPQKTLFSRYEDGDVVHKLELPQEGQAVACKVGMATAAALFPFAENSEKEIDITVPLDMELHPYFPKYSGPGKTWSNLLAERACLRLPDAKIEFLYDAAVRTLLLLSAGEVVAGPYTYKRFWFRDACFMINALLAQGYGDRCYRLLDNFLELQKRSGYFQSQEGEWDSNGQVLWIFDRFQQLTGRSIGKSWLKAIHKAVKWIKRKRIYPGKKSRHNGLLPPGFSAEHLGPNDYYYWDDFWSVAGLRFASRMLKKFSSAKKADVILNLANDFEKCIYDSIKSIPAQKRRGAIPASPYRRLDSGAVGSLSADYPLRLTPPGDPRIIKTAEFLIENCFQSGGFYQDMIHSGINAYLTLCIAQTLLRAGDIRYRRMIRAVADFASSTGQWPEAIHPLTGGGCMGDGQHGWAAAEWIMMIRNMFVREEGDKLILGSGIFPEWLETGKEFSFGPTLTDFGSVGLSFSHKRENLFLNVQSSWHDQPPPVEIRVPGYKQKNLTDFDQPCVLKKLDL